jgi:hypothetical protein
LAIVTSRTSSKLSAHRGVADLQRNGLCTYRPLGRLAPTPREAGELSLNHSTRALPSLSCRAIRFPCGRN